jgi:hypothetical protein
LSDRARLKKTSYWFIHRDKAHYAGRWGEAEAAFRKALDLNPRYPGAHTFLGRIYLERCYKQRDGGLSDMKGDPLLRNIEKDPRYRPFLQKMNLPL